MFNTPLPPDNYNGRTKIQKANANVGMKKNLKLIKRDRDHKQIEEKFNKIYEKLKINLEPIQESQLSKFKELASQVNQSLADAYLPETDLNMITMINPSTTKN